MDGRDMGVNGLKLNETSGWIKTNVNVRQAGKLPKVSPEAQRSVNSIALETLERSSLFIAASVFQSWPEI